MVDVHFFYTLAQWWACLTRDLVAVSSIPGWGELSFLMSVIIRQRPNFHFSRTLIALLRCQFWPLQIWRKNGNGWCSLLLHVGSVVSVSDSWPGGCEFDTRLRRTFFSAYFHLSHLKHVRIEVCGFGKKVVLDLVLVWEIQETHVRHRPPWYDLSC